MHLFSENATSILPKTLVISESEKGVPLRSLFPRTVDRIFRIVLEGGEPLPARSDAAHLREVRQVVLATGAGPHSNGRCPTKRLWGITG